MSFVILYTIQSFTSTVVLIHNASSYRHADFASDPLAFQYLGKHPNLSAKCTFIDVDYPALMRRKLEMIQQNEPLSKILADLQVHSTTDVEIARSSGYRAYACDLRHLDKLDSALRQGFDLEFCSVAILCIAEVSVAYMDATSANALLKWVATLEDGMLNSFGDSKKR